MIFRMSKPAASVAHHSRDRRRFDAAFPESERLPPSLALTFEADGEGVRLLQDGLPVGDRLTDSRRSADGYRFHDALHLALATKLGWSPVLRSILGRKRRSDPEVDECEDGGRACMVEEAACHLIHVYRDEARTLDGRTRLIELLRRATEGFEVESCGPTDWEEAISLGLDLQSGLLAFNGGMVLADLVAGEASLLQPRTA
jgi:hypothetical protein